MSKKSKQSPINVGETIASLRNQIAQILRALSVIQVYQPDDTRAFSAMDLIEAIEVTEQVVISRLEEGMFEEWKNDHKQEYYALFRSIQQQLKETNVIIFQNQDGKMLRFVNSYNTLVIPRLFDMFRLLGPAATMGLIGPLSQDMRNTIEDVECNDEVDLAIAQSLLGTFRKNYQRPPLSISTREQMIRNICERVQQNAA